MNKKFISSILAAVCIASNVSGAFAEEALSISQWRNMMTEFFSKNNWQEVLRVASIDARDITTETHEITVDVDEDKISDLHYEVLGVQTEVGDKYDRFFENGQLKESYVEFCQEEESFKIPVLRWGGASTLGLKLLNNIGPFDERKGTSAVQTHDGATQEGRDAMRTGPIEYLQIMYANNPKMKLIPCPSPFMETPQDIENIAHFLLDEKDESEWGAKRAELGIEEPVDVWYWELGNEVDWSIGGVKGDKSRAIWYIDIAKQFTEAIRKVDPDAKICVCGPTAAWRDGWKMWHQTIMPELVGLVDAISFHPYFDGYSTETCFKYMDIIKRDIDSYVAEQDIRDENGNLKDIKIISTEGARFYGYNESYTYPGSMDFQSAVYTSHWLNNSFQHDYFIGNMYHNINSAIFCWSFWHIDGDEYYHTAIEKMYKLYQDYLGDRIIGTDWSFYGTGKPTAPDQAVDSSSGDNVYMSNDLYRWSTVFNTPDEPFISSPFSVLASGKGRDEITLFLCNRQMYRDLDITFNFKNDYTLVEEAIFTAPNMTTFTFSDESEDLIKTVVTPKNEENFSSYHMKGLSVAVLKLKTKSQLSLTAEEVAAGGAGSDGAVEVDTSDSFADIQNHWAKNEITYMKNAGMVSGRSSQEFDPNAAITNAEISSVISKMLGLEGEYTGSAFIDVPVGQWYTGFANNLYMNGILRSRSFKPDQIPTIYEVIKTADRICRKYLDTPAPDKKIVIDNVPEEYREVVESAASYGALNRLFENGELNYDKAITRAEAVMILYNVYRKI